MVISIAELIKSVTQEYTFPKRTLAAMGMVLRPTKDLYILMNDSSFRHNELSPAVSSPLHTFSFQSMMAPQMMPATPLSAALGPAAQATMPLLYQQQNVPSGYSAAGSRTGTLLSGYAPTMTSAVAEVGMNFPANGMNSPLPRIKPV